MAKDGELTPKQEKFIQGIVGGLSQREAYKEAYDCTNMKDKSVDECASRMMAKETSRARLHELQAESKERHLSKADAVITELAHIAFDDISNYLDYKQDAEGNIKIRLKDSKKIDTRGVAEVSLTKDGTFKFKMYAKDNALIQLGKHMGLFVDRSMQLNIDAGENSSIAQAVRNNPDLTAKAIELYRISKGKDQVN